MMPQVAAAMPVSGSRVSDLRHWCAAHARAVEAGAAILLFLALAIVRTWGISDTFWLYGEQIRDWTLALGSWRDLPLSGTPSTAGGRSLGPVYYWALWLIRHVVGPWCDNLPHAGGIGLSLIQSAADAWLFVAVWRRFESWALALALVIAVATEPYDLALTATIWNPPLAVAFVKAAIALVLGAGERPTMRRVLAVTVIAWLAVQAHSSALFFAVPVIAAFPLRDIAQGRWREGLRFGRACLEVIAVLQLPYLADRLLHPAVSAAPTAVLARAGQVAAHPAGANLLVSARGVAAAMESILGAPWPLPWFPAVTVLAMTFAVVAARKDLAIASLVTAPLALAAIGLSILDRPFETYWFLSLAPCFALGLACGAVVLPARARPIATALALAVALLAAPARLERAHQIHRLPEYGWMVKGAREARRHTRTLKAVEVVGELPATVDPAFLYTSLGGTLDASASLVAVIDRSGHVAYRTVAVP